MPLVLMQLGPCHHAAVLHAPPLRSISDFALDHRQADFTVVLHLRNPDGNILAQFQVVLDLRDIVLSDLGDVNHSQALPVKVNKGAELSNALDKARVLLPNLELLGAEARISHVFVTNSRVPPTTKTRPLHLESAALVHLHHHARGEDPIFRTPCHDVVGLLICPAEDSPPHGLRPDVVRLSTSFRVIPLDPEGAILVQLQNGSKEPRPRLALSGDSQAVVADLVISEYSRLLDVRSGEVLDGSASIKDDCKRAVAIVRDDLTLAPLAVVWRPRPRPATDDNLGRNRSRAAQRGASSKMGCRTKVRRLQT
mmetsp:Transcript_81145/g.211571  ORF Transcript_81145/g.211571 Transcript_81145/m.211571 type:complete len:310 (-) Transcript_81145:175-1104(-)